jgi:ECF transporter S component (folate family)
MSQTNKNTARRGSVGLFGTTSVLVISALLIAMSIVLGKLLAFNIGDSIRVSLENLPLLMAGIFFGPLVGAAVGAGADIIGCLIVGYSINPIITIGAALIGFVAGMVSHGFVKSRSVFGVAACVLPAHIIGSMIVKSIGLKLYFHTPYQVLLLRVPLYICVGIVESYIIYLLLKNKGFSAQLEKVTRK